MGYSRSFFRREKKTGARQAGAPARRDDAGRMHVTLYSELFGKNAGRAMWTNSVYAGLLGEIETSVSLCPVRERIVLEVFCPGLAEELERERLLIGFHRYLSACEAGQRRKNLFSLFLFFAFLLLGTSMIFVLYQFLLTLIPIWTEVLLETVATVFIWQFVGYMAFEFPSERRRLRRLIQIGNAEFEFREWD